MGTRTRDLLAAVIAVSTLLAVVPASAALPERRTMASGAAGVTVKMLDDKFKPKTVSVSKGSKVKWVNKGEDDHTTTGKGWDATLSPGQTFSRKFKKAGTFKYRCSFHSEMVGKVVVTS